MHTQLTRHWKFVYSMLTPSALFEKKKLSLEANRQGKIILLTYWR